MDFPEFDEMFKQINRSLRLSGISPHHKRLDVKFYILFAWLLMMIIEELIFFVSRISSENFLELTALAPCTGIGVLSVAKIICLALKKDKLFKLMREVKQLHEDISNNPKKREIVASELVFVKSLTKYFFILNSSVIVVYNFSTLVLMLYDYYFNGEVIYHLPFAVIVPFSTDSLMPWLVVYLHSIMAGFICVLFYTATDALYYNLTCNVCNNFTILSKDIENLEPSDVGSLNEIVKRHQYILRLTCDLEDIFTAINLWNVLVGSIEICALGFNLTMGDLIKLPGVILFLLSELLQILLMSVFGENIITESRKVGESAFLCKWYNMDLEAKKKILIIMIRSTKPQTLTAYKFSVICYESFTRIIGTSWSYFTILRSVYNSPEE